MFSMKLKSWAVGVALALAATPVMARKADTVNRFKHTTAAGSVNLLDGIACNAAAAARTITLPLGSTMARAEVFVYFTYAAATSVSFTPTCSMDSGTTYANYTSRSCSSGTCTVSEMVDSNSTGGADFDVKLVYDTAACDNFKLVIACTGGGASDTFIVQAASLSGGE